MTKGGKCFAWCLDTHVVTTALKSQGVGDILQVGHPIKEKLFFLHNKSDMLGNIAGDILVLQILFLIYFCPFFEY